MSKRKPALRIGGGVLNRNTLSSTEKAPAKDFQNWDSTENAYVRTGAQDSIDAEVANFLKEIDEVGVSESCLETVTDQPVRFGDWRQCVDDKTQHQYYWNTVTNEVTWVLPEEVTVHLQKQATEDGSNASPVDIKKGAPSEESNTRNDEPEKKTIKLVEDYESELKGESDEESNLNNTSLNLDDKVTDDIVDQELESALENKVDGDSQLQKTQDVESGLWPNNEREQKHSSPATDCDSPAKHNGKSDQPILMTEKEIAEVTQTLLSKMKFLGISKAALMNLHVLLIEIETRIADWKADALSSAYLLIKLQEAHLQLKNYEESATPAGWSCHWDSSMERYFYMDEKTLQKQWQYPELRDVDNISKTDSENANPTSPDGTDDNDVPAADYPSPSRKTVESPPPLPDTPLEKPPLPPQHSGDGFEVGDEEGDEQENDDGIMMEISDSEKEEESEKKPSANTAVMSQQPVLYKGPTGNYNISSVPQTVQFKPHHMAQGTKIRASSEPKAVTTKVKKKKKSSAVKKPSKGMTSLVAKWQRAKDEIEEDDRMLEEDDDEQELDRGEMTQAQIEKWKHDQIASGKAFSNANFEPVPDDWRTMLLKKKRKKL